MLSHAVASEHGTRWVIAEYSLNTAGFNFHLEVRLVKESLFSSRSFMAISVDERDMTRREPRGEERGEKSGN